MTVLAAVLPVAFDHWLFHPLIGRGYQFFSGIAPCFLSLGLLTGAAAWVKHHNCHQKGCWRVGHHHPDHGRPVCDHHFHQKPTLGRRRS